MFQKRTEIPWPESAAAVQSAKRKFENAQTELETAMREMSEARRKIDLVQGEASVGADPVSVRQHLTPLREKFEKAAVQREEVKARIPNLEIALREARSAACREIVASVKPAHDKLVKTTILAQIERDAAEIVALVEIANTKTEMQVRRIGHSDLLFGDALRRKHAEFEMLRADVIEAVEAGVVAVKDIPTAVRTVWGIK